MISLLTVNTKINSFGWRIKLKKKQNHSKLEENDHLPVLRMRESLSNHKRKG